MVYLASEAILGIDADTGLIVEANAMAEEITGYTQAELLKFKAWELHPVNDESKLKNILEKVKHEGKGISDQLILKSKTGEMISLGISSSLVNFGNKKLIQNIYWESNQGFSQIKNKTDSTGIFEHVLDLLPIGLGVIKYINNSPQIEFENKKLQQMFPKDAEGVPSFSWYEKLSNEYREKDFNEDGWYSEEKALPDNKVYRFISSFLRRERNSWSEIRLIQDITERHNKERQLKQTNQNLEKKIEKRSRELQDKQAQLIQSEKMASLGNLMAGVAHEINTPLGALKSNIEVLDNIISKLMELQNTYRKKQIDSTEDESLKYLKKAESLNNINITALERIISIVDSLRNFARLDEAKLQIVDIHKSLRSSITLVQHQIKDRIEIITNFSNIPLIPCYPDQLNQVFMNILVNAIQAIEDRGKVFVETYIEDENVVVKIRDTGHGISEENLEKIFDPGYTTKAAEIGTGLGLSIVDQIIEKHNGKIEVISNVGEGTTFTIIIPVK
jgi:PAS domain S-box-containing protein